MSNTETEEKFKYESENALKKIDIIADRGFKIGDKTYFLEPQISPERYRVMTSFEIELSYSTTFKKMYRDLGELKAQLNQARFVDSAVKLRDIMEGLHRLDDKGNHHAIMKYCACIINTHDEDRRAFDEKIMDEKITAWNEAGIPISSFFAVVLHSVDGLWKSYKDDTQDTSLSQLPKTPKKN